MSVRESIVDAFKRISPLDVNHLFTDQQIEDYFSTLTGTDYEKARALATFKRAAYHRI